MTNIKYGRYYNLYFLKNPEDNSIELYLSIEF